MYVSNISSKFKVLRVIIIISVVDINLKTFIEHITRKDTAIINFMIKLPRDFVSINLDIRQESLVE